MLTTTRIKVILIAIVVTGNIFNSVCANLITEPKVRMFVDEMVSKHGFNAIDLTNLLSHAKLQQDVIDAMNRPAENKPWYEYREKLVTAERIEAGIQFWNKNIETLREAEKVYGVPPQIIVAILGIETKYGTRVGAHRVLDSLMTLTFEYPKRNRFFRSELESFLLMTREERFDPLVIKGSYAGAMGQPQFISSSYRHYAVDFDQDGHRDLFDNTTDSIGSVANYFKRNRWKRNEQIAMPANVSGNKYLPLLKKGVRPRINTKDLSSFGIKPADDLPVGEKVSLVKYELKDAEEFWLGLYNFYVITRYNRSPLYAMAVYQLSEKIRTQRQRQLLK